MISNVIDGVLETSIFGSFSRVGFSLRRELEHWQPNKEARIAHIVITGASSGLGQTLAVLLAGRSNHLSLIGRDESRLSETAELVRAQGGNAQCYATDISDLVALQNLTINLRDAPPVDVLVNNAGALSHSHHVSAQGIELTVAVHVVAPYALQRHLVMSPRGKVITMTSGGMYTERFDLSRLEMTPESYRGTTAYARAKRAQVVLTSALQRQSDTQRSYYAVHPGWARTPGLDDALPLFSKALRPILRTSEEGVDTTAWLATLPEGEPPGGGLWLDRRERPIYRLKKTVKTFEEERRDEVELLKWLESRTSDMS